IDRAVVLFGKHAVVAPVFIGTLAGCGGRLIFDLVLALLTASPPSRAELLYPSWLSRSACIMALGYTLAVHWAACCTSQAAFAAIASLLVCSCPALRCPALPCPALPCPALPCPALPCPALPCPALPCPPCSYARCFPGARMGGHFRLALGPHCTALRPLPLPAVSPPHCRLPSLLLALTFRALPINPFPSPGLPPTQLLALTSHRAVALVHISCCDILVLITYFPAGDFSHIPRLSPRPTIFSTPLYLSTSHPTAPHSFLRIYPPFHSSS
ncbi:unnamed protein product, partial [Closterium sp. NIES-53]